MSTPKSPSQPTTPDMAARLEALELMLQALVLVLECEPRFSGAKLGAWLDASTGRMATTGSASAQTLAALVRLQREVLQ